jgi:hypothetical protein
MICIHGTFSTICENAILKIKGLGWEGGGILNCCIARLEKQRAPLKQVIMMNHDTPAPWVHRIVSEWVCTVFAVKQTPVPAQVPVKRVHGVDPTKQQPYLPVCQEIVLWVSVQACSIIQYPENGACS